MINFLQFLIKTNIDNYSEDNYNYFLHLKKLLLNTKIKIQKSDSYDQFIAIENFNEKLENIFNYLYLIKIGTKVNYEEVDKCVSSLMNPFCLLLEEKKINSIHLFLQEFYILKKFNIKSVNDFLLQKLFLFQKTNFFDENILNIVISNPNILIKYSSYNIDFYVPEFHLQNMIKLFNIYSDNTYQLLIAFKSDIINTFSNVNFESFYLFLMTKKDLSHLLPNFIFQKIINHEDYDIILTEYFCFIFETENYYIIKEKISKLFHIEYIFDEYETRLNIENF